MWQQECSSAEGKGGAGVYFNFILILYYIKNNLKDITRTKDQPLISLSKNSVQVTRTEGEGRVFSAWKGMESDVVWGGAKWWT